MTPLRIHRLLGPSWVVGISLVGLTVTIDLLRLTPVFPVPWSAVAFLSFVVVQGFSMSRRIRKAEAATAELNASLAQSTNELRIAAEAYSRFVPDQFLRHLNRESISQVQLGDQVARQMTVLFSDIRDFTSLSEGMTPEENFRFLNRYLGQIGPIIRQNYGFIDKYIGDAVMALFDGPVDEALQAAIEMQLATTSFNEIQCREGLPPIEIGVGLHAGPLMLGIIGEMGRMESTVIADAVNLASRIESLTKHYHCRILVSRPTFEAQSDPQPLQTRPVDLVRVKGRLEAIELLEILDPRFDPGAELKMEHSARLAEAMMTYRRGNFLEARVQFQALAYRDPSDRLYGIFRKRIEEFIRLGTPDHWDGTTVFDVK